MNEEPLPQSTPAQDSSSHYRRRRRSHQSSKHRRRRHQDLTPEEDNRRRQRRALLYAIPFVLIPVGLGAWVYATRSMYKELHDKEMIQIGQIMLVIGVVSCFGLNSQLTIGVMARVAFGRGSGQYGLLGSVFAVGALIGSLQAARRVRPRVRLVLAATMIFGVASGLSALAPTYELFAASLVLVGFATLTLITAANAWPQSCSAFTCPFAGLYAL